MKKVGGKSQHRETMSETVGTTYLVLASFAMQSRTTKKQRAKHEAPKKRDSERERQPNQQQIESSISRVLQL